MIAYLDLDYVFQIEIFTCGEPASSTESLALDYREGYTNANKSKEMVPNHDTVFLFTH